MGYQACRNASKVVEEGSVGVGTGATVGKLFGIDRAMKGGVGTSSVKGPNGLIVGALVVVNALGDVFDPDSKEILAGARTSKKSLRLSDSSKWIKQGVTRKPFSPAGHNDFTFCNTTLGVMVTNGCFSKKEMHQTIQMAHGGLSKVISPIHTPSDGDMLFGISLGKKKSDVTTVGLLGEVVLMDAVKRAVIKADGFGVIPAYRDLKKKR